MAGVDHLVVYMQTAIKYNSLYVHHPGVVYIESVVFYSSLHIHHHMVHNNHFPIFSRPKPSGGVHLWGPYVLQIIIAFAWWAKSCWLLCEYLNIYLVVFFGASFKFLKFRVSFCVFSLPDHSEEVGDVFKCIGDGFCIELHREMGKTIGKSIRSEHFGILQFWEFFCQPFGENQLSKNAPKTNNGNLKQV